MNIIQKWNEIVNWQKSNLEIEEEQIIEDLNEPITQENINLIEEITGEKLPESFVKLYLKGNGQPDSFPLFFGLKFIESQDIVESLKYAKSLIKPEKQTVDNPEKSQELLEKIVQFYTSFIPQGEFFGLKKNSWYKLEFSFGLDSFGGPYLYKSENTISREREIFKISNYEPIKEIVRELYELEYESYNWDEIEVVAYADGQFETERINYNFDDEISFTSTPEHTIKKKYLNHKWIPVFSDYGGNFIGIDLDPDKKGKKGQIINFGRDEEKMFVIADDLEHFFDLIIYEFNKNEGQSLKSKNHFIDILRGLKKY
jgi:cell wall assembly regulator SMI1